MIHFLGLGLGFPGPGVALAKLFLRLELVEGGEPVVIARLGTPVAEYGRFPILHCA